MKITVFMGPWFPVPTVQGGSHHRLWHRLAEEFAGRGHEVTVLCRAYPGQPAREIASGVTYIRCGGFKQSTSTALNLAKDFVYAFLMLPLAPRADIMVINDFWFPVLVAPFRRRTGKTVISVGRFPKGQMSLYRKADRIAALSHSVRRGIEEQTPALASRVRVFANPTDTQIFTPPETPRPSGQGKTILYVGRVHPEKGLHLLVEAFAILSRRFADAKLKIVGPVKEEQGGGGNIYLRELEDKAAKLNVEFSEPIFDVSKLSEIYRSADLFCYPSLAEKGEAFPVAPLEAMATGLVPVVSDLDCFRDLIEDEATGLFFNHRGEAAAQNLADKLSAAILDEARLRDMGRRAAERAQGFGYAEIAELYLQDFGELLGGELPAGKLASVVE